MRASSRDLASVRGLAVSIIGACLMVLAAEPVVAAAMADPTWIRFPSARAEPSALALRAFEGRAGVAAHRSAATVHALLLAPAGRGPYPAVVLLHDCRGVRGNHRSWANWFASNGYVALLVDSFYGRNAINMCSRGPDSFAEQAIGGRVFDAFGALEYLAGDERVDASRVAVLSWGDALAISATADAGARRLVARGFRAGVAIGADCPMTGDRRSAPLLLVAPGDNVWARPGNCRAFAASARGHAPPVELLELPGAAFGFDDPEVGGGMLLSAAYNPWTSPRRGVPLRYDAHAHRRSEAAVGEFLHRHLQLHDLLETARPDEGYGPGHWVVDPNRPGVRLPGVGASVFDTLLARWRSRGYPSVPFPFQSLVAELREVAGVDDAGRPGLKATFIPLGRSLQRNAAAPQFYRYPRVLLTVDGEPAAADPEPGIFLKNRLFIGYQEKAAALEVISWNPVLGRFEFQVVDGYDDGGPARVRYANRTLCVSCHHNQSPVFPRAAWDETHDNLSIFRRLRRERPDLYGLRAEAAATPAALFDNATDRAGDLSLWNLLWNEGCGDDSDGALRCRRELIKAALHYRLSSSNSFDAGAEAFRGQVVDRLRDSLRRRFGDSLQVAGADLPNRDPVLESEPTQLPPRMDPLTPRPVTRLGAADADTLARDLVHGLALQLPRADVAAFDAALEARASERVPRRRVDLHCELEQRGQSQATALVRLRCGAPQRPALQLELSVEEGVLGNGQVRALRLSDEPTQERIVLRARDPAARVRAGQVLEFGLQRRHGGLSVRLGHGERVEVLRVLWPAADIASRRTPIARFYPVTAELVLVDDVAPLHAAIAALPAPHRSSGDGGPGVLAAGVFSGEQTARALRALLGLAPRAPCCAPAIRPVHQGEPPARQSSLADLAPGPPPATLSREVQRFRHSCGECHSAPGVSPPGFLFGDDPQVLGQLRHCAQRIFLRLAMWQLAPGDRPRSPMPPASMAGGQRSLPVAELRELAAAWIAEDGAGQPSAQAMLGRGYESARSCLADDTARSRSPGERPAAPASSIGEAL